MYWKPKIGANFWAYQLKTRTVHHHHAETFGFFTAIEYVHTENLKASGLGGVKVELKMSEWRFLPAPNKIPKTHIFPLQS